MSQLKKILLSAFAVFFAILFIAAVVPYGQSGPIAASDQTVAIAAEREKSASSFDTEAAGYRAEQKVKELLRDPGSADFRNVIVVRHANSVAVCGEVNAKNGFGGFAGFTHFISLEASTAIRSEANATQFQRIWNSACH